MGQEVTEENKQNVKDMMKKSRETMGKSNLKGIATEIHLKIKIDNDLKQNDFKFKLPEGTVLKKSLFDGLGENNNKTKTK